MIQSILDLYPDSVSQYGLLGCAYVTVLPIMIVAAFLWYVRR